MVMKQKYPPPPYFFVFSSFYAYFRLGQVKLYLPRRVRKEVLLGLAGLKTPEWAKIKKNKKKKKGGGGYQCSKTKTQDSPKFSRNGGTMDYGNILLLSLGRLKLVQTIKHSTNSFQQRSYSIITYVRLSVRPSVCQVQGKT